MRTELQQIVIDGATEAGVEDHHKCDCGWSSCHSLAYLILIQRERVHPIQMLDRSVSQLVETLEQMDDPRMPQQRSQCSYRWHSDPKYRLRRSLKLEKLKQSHGLCIDCVRVDEGAEKGVCRINH
jgi:hypothetical protein